MGLFSKFGKNKQQSPEDSGYYRAADDRAITERARSKRASSADAGAEPRAGAGASRARGRKEAADPVLPEKKRARRRLVGAIALALAVAIGLPMVLDSEPKPLANDIAIQIPPKDKPDNDKAEGAKVGDDVTVAAIDDKTAQAEALDQSEEIIEPADDTPEPVMPPKAAATEPKPLPPKPEALKPEPPKVAERKHEPKHEARPAGWDEPKPEPKKVADVKPEPKKAEPKPVEPKPAPKTDDAARALALLEGKAAPAASATPATPATPAASADSGRYVIQVAALSARDKVEELQGKLRDAGIKSFTQKSPTGELTRVKVGPFGSREEAEKAKARLQKIGLSGSLSPA